MSVPTRNTPSSVIAAFGPGGGAVTVFTGPGTVCVPVGPATVARAGPGRVFVTVGCGAPALADGDPLSLWPGVPMIRPSRKVPAATTHGTQRRGFLGGGCGCGYCGLNGALNCGLGTDP